MKAVTVSQLKDLFAAMKSCHAVSVDTVTIPSMRKTGNPYVGAVKVQTMNGLIGFDYANAVNNQLAREDNDNAFEFVPHTRKWGVLMDNRNMVEHKGKYYLQMKVQSLSGKPRYMMDGQEIDSALVKPFLQEKSKVGTQAAVGIEKEVIVRDVELGNIRAIRMDGEEYVIGETVKAEVEAEAVKEIVTA